MNKDKKSRLVWVIGAIIVVAIGLGLMAKGRNTDNYDENKMTLFYSNSCPHCKIVEEYIKDNNVEEKFDFNRLEVSMSPRNSQRLADRAETCGLDPNALGVPFLWTGSECLMGDVDIIEFFKS